MEQEKVLLNVEETAAYLNLGMTKTRELMRENEKIFVVRYIALCLFDSSAFGGRDTSAWR